MKVGTFIAAAGLAIGVVLLGLVSGCATIYKSTAGDYVDAAKQITGAMQASSAALAAADNSWKGSLIAQDRSCPIDRQIVYLRPAAIDANDLTPEYFDSLANAPGVSSQIQTECRVLRLNAGSKAACFSAEEASCIDELNHFYMTTAAQPDANGDEKNTAAKLKVSLARLAYGAPLPDSYLAVSSVRIISAYLDVLSKAADGQTSDLKKQAEDLSNDIKSTASTYKSLTGQNLLAPATLTSGESKLNAFGAFAQDIEVMAQTAKDTATIEAAVKKTAPDAEAAMDMLQQLTVSDARLAGTLAALAAQQQRETLLRKFRDLQSPAAREIVIAQLQALPADNTAILIKSAGTIFDKAKSSHATLVQLIENPSQAQLAQIRAQDFASFRSAAQDMGSLFLLLVK